MMMWTQNYIDAHESNGQISTGELVKNNLSSMLQSELIECIELEFCGFFMRVFSLERKI